MSPVVNILFGSLLTVAVSWALGTILLRKLSLELYRVEERLLAFVTGSACLSLIIFVLCVLKLAHRGVFLALGFLILAWAFRIGAHRGRGKEFAPLHWVWKATFAAVFLAYTYLYFFNAMAPENSPDAMAYHLGTVAKYYRAHGFEKITTNFYSNLSQGVELLFLYAFVFGKHSAAAMFHFAYLVALSLLMLAYGRRIGYPGVGIAGALFFYASPIVGRDATVAYVDVGLAAAAFSLFYFLQIWLDEQDHRLLAPAGILSGFCFAIKYTGLTAVLYALALVVWKLWRLRKPVLRPVLTIASLACLSIIPWVAKNWILVGDPVAPFANRMFPNPYVHISFEDDWLNYEHRYDLPSYWQIPEQLTISGSMLQGMFGPLFLLTPLSLLALRMRAGRQLLLAAGMFALSYYGNIGTRFLIPAAAFIALAIPLALANLNWLLLVLVIGHSILSWPAIVERYSGKYTWRVMNVPIKQALRIEPEQEYLSKFTSEYVSAQLLEKHVPRGERVFAFSQTADSYTSKEVLARYTAARNETIGRILWTPLFDALWPTRIIQFQFPARDLQRIRVRQTAQCKTAHWSIAEMRVLRSGRELERAPEWRLSAHPNPFEVQMAFDNRMVTEWRSWEVCEPGMLLEVDLGHPQTIDQVVLESPGDDDQSSSVLEGLDASGKWTMLSSAPIESKRPVTHSLRWEAAQDVKALGVRYVLVLKSDLGSEDFERFTPLWGMKCLGTAGSARLYYIE
jgi:hypothetical protein